MYRAAVGVGVGAALLLTWVNLAVGIIGEPDERANVLYLGVPAVGIIGAVIARLEPRGMARALFATALAQALIAAIALILGWGAPGTGPLEIVALNGMFVALFAGSAWLFRLGAGESLKRTDALASIRACCRGGWGTAAPPVPTLPARSEAAILPHSGRRAGTSPTSRVPARSFPVPPPRTPRGGTGRRWTRPRW